MVITKTHIDHTSYSSYLTGSGENKYTLSDIANSIARDLEFDGRCKRQLATKERRKKLMMSWK